MNKKAIFILGSIFLLIVGTLGFLIYSRYVSNNKDAPPPVQTGNSSTTPQNNGDNGQEASTTPFISSLFVKLTESEQVVSPALFYNGNGVTYMDNRGALFKSDFDASEGGQLKLTRTRNLSIPSKTGVTRILWPKNGDDFIVEMSDYSGNHAYSYFNFATGNYIDLPTQIKALEWMPSGSKIIFVWVDKDAGGKEKASLNIADPDTKNYQQIAELWESDDSIYLSPDGLNLALHRTQNEASTNKIVLTSADGKVWRDLVKEGYNFGVLWSPDSQKLLFSKRDRSGGSFQLWYYDLYSGEVKNLGLNTVPQKAVWASDSRTIFVAAPEEASVIINPKNMRDTFTKDIFYKIDTSSAGKNIYTPENEPLDGRDMFLNSSEDKLFFRNAQDGGLYYLDLTK